MVLVWGAADVGCDKFVGSGLAFVAGSAHRIVAG